MNRVFKAYMDSSSAPLLVKEEEREFWGVYKEDAPEHLIGVLVRRFPSLWGWGFGHPEHNDDLSVAMTATLENVSTTGEAYRGFLADPQGSLRWGSDGRTLRLRVLQEVTPPCPEGHFSRLRACIRTFGRGIYVDGSAQEWELWQQTVAMPAAMAGTDVSLADLRRALRAEGWTEVYGRSGRWWKDPN